MSARCMTLSKKELLYGFLIYEQRSDKPVERPVKLIPDKQTKLSIMQSVAAKNKLKMQQIYKKVMATPNSLPRLQMPLTQLLPALMPLNARNQYYKLLMKSKSNGKKDDQPPCHMNTAATPGMDEENNNTDWDVLDDLPLSLRMYPVDVDVYEGLNEDEVEEVSGLRCLDEPYPSPDSSGYGDALSSDKPTKTAALYVGQASPIPAPPSPPPEDHPDVFTRRSVNKATSEREIEVIVIDDDDDDDDDEDANDDDSSLLSCVTSVNDGLPCVTSINAGLLQPVLSLLDVSPPKEILARSRRLSCSTSTDTEASPKTSQGVLSEQGSRLPSSSTKECPLLLAKRTAVNGSETSSRMECPLLLATTSSPRSSLTVASSQSQQATGEKSTSAEAPEKRMRTSDGSKGVPIFKPLVVQCERLPIGPGKTSVDEFVKSFNLLGKPEHLANGKDKKGPTQKPEAMEKFIRAYNLLGRPDNLLGNPEALSTSGPESRSTTSGQNTEMTYTTTESRPSQGVPVSFQVVRPRLSPPLFKQIVIPCERLNTENLNIITVPDAFLTDLQKKTSLLSASDAKGKNKAGRKDGKQSRKRRATSPEGSSKAKRRKVAKTKKEKGELKLKSKRRKLSIPDHYRSYKPSQLPTITTAKMRYRVAFTLWPERYGGALDRINQRLQNQNAFWNGIR